MQYNTALGFVLCGVALTGLAFGRRLLAIVPSALAALLGVLTLSEYIFRVDLGIDELLMAQPITDGVSHLGRMAPNTALCFALTGAGIVSGVVWKRAAPWPHLLGGIVAALATAALFGYIGHVPTAYGWGRMTHMSVHTASGFVVAGTGLYAVAWRLTGWRKRTAFVPVSAGLAVLVQAALIWQAMQAQELSERRTVAESIAHDAAAHTEERLRFNLLAFEHMAELSGDSGGLSPEIWTRNALRYLEGFPSVSAIALLDSHGAEIMRVTRDATPDEQSEQPFSGAISDTIDRLRSDPSLFACTSGRGSGNPPQIVAAYPTPIDGTDRRDGWLVVLLPERAFLDRAFEPFARSCAIIASDPNEPPPGWASSTGASDHAHALCALDGVAWRLDVELTPAYAAKLHSAWVFAIPTIGVLAAISLSAVLTLLQRSNRIRADQRALLHELGLQKYALDEASIVAITDPAGVITYANDKFCAVSGYSREELIGRTHKILNSGHHPKAFFTDLWRTIANGRTWMAEVCNRAKDGSLYWVDTTIVPFTNNAGKIEKYVAIRTDITERKRAKTLIEEGRQREELAINATGLGIWAWHVETGRVRWNDRMFLVYGMAPTDDGSVSYADWRSAVVPEDLADQEQELQEVAGGHREPGTRRFRIRRHSDGAIRHVEAIDVVRKSAAGRIEWVVGTNWDITDRIRAEEALRQKNEELERFVYSASHDLKSPLVTILGYSTHLVRDAERHVFDEITGYAQRITRAAERMRSCIDDLLAISRVGRTDIEIEPVRLEDVVCAVQEEQAASIEEAGVSFEVDLQIDEVMCNRSHVHQVLANLIGNAVKYGSTATRPVVSIRSRPGETGLVELAVDDNGHGIDERHADRVFELFQRLDSDKEGTGVGLALVRRIAEQYGGRAWTIATPGDGGKFRVLLPQCPAQNPHDVGPGGCDELVAREQETGSFSAGRG
ncbi:MAG: PAS domain S-box protein [Phycisphaeraceae bacterium]|nr:MAG: PAS domain S-box protein [Phycisphaeraceae bacterium]